MTFASRAVRVSVVICTFNRAASLGQTLGSLCALRVPPHVEWECLVVNNNCTDRTDEVLASFAVRLPLRRLAEPLPGLAHARNHAVRECAGDLILWLDDDIHVDREWLAAYVEAATRWPSAAYFGGSIQPRYLCEPPGWMTANPETLRGVLGVREFGPVEQPFPEGEEPYGGNMAIRHWVFEQWRFDEALGHHAADRLLGEETALFAHLRHQGCEGVWVSEARALHTMPADHLTVAFVRSHFTAYGRSLVRRGDAQRTWILGYPRLLSRAFCLLTRARVWLRRLIGRPSWVSLLARCATWEGMLDEARGRDRS